MKNALLCALAAACTAISSAAAAEDPREELIAAIKKLGDAPNFTYTVTGSSSSNRRTRNTHRTSEFQIEKPDLAYMALRYSNFTNVVVIKGTAGVIKTEDGWKTLADAESRVLSPGDARRQSRVAARGFLDDRGKVIQLAVTAAIEKQARALKNLKFVDDAFIGELPPEEFGGRTFGPGTGVVMPTKAQGTVKYWLKQGVLWKTETDTETEYGEDDHVSSLTNIEYKNVGTTKIKIPDEAQKLLDRPTQ